MYRSAKIRGLSERNERWSLISMLWDFSQSYVLEFSVEMTVLDDGRKSRADQYKHLKYYFANTLEQQ